jgi:hypothetical protein
MLKSIKMQEKNRLKIMKIYSYFLLFSFYINAFAYIVSLRKPTSYLSTKLPVRLSAASSDANDFLQVNNI